MVSFFKKRLRSQVCSINGLLALHGQIGKTRETEGKRQWQRCRKSTMIEGRYRTQSVEKCQLDYNFLTQGTIHG